MKAYQTIPGDHRRPPISFLVGQITSRFILFLILGIFIHLPHGLLSVTHAHPGGHVQTQPILSPPLVSAMQVKAERLFQWIVSEAARNHDVEPALIKAMIFSESRYNHRAISRSGAKGLMQLMPKTAHALGVKDSFDPAQNVNGGVRYFKQLLDKFEGDIILALAAYNAGSSAVIRYQGVPPIGATRHYIRKVLKYYKHYRMNGRKGQDNR